MSAVDEGYLLIVDDQPAICELLSEVFVSEGYQVKAAMNSNEAIHAIQTGSPALIFMDINMPGKNGLETLREVRGLIHNVPVIMITAYGEMDDVMEAKKQGLIQYYITKPFDIILMIKLVKRIVSPAGGFSTRLTGELDRFASVPG